MNRPEGGMGISLRVREIRLWPEIGHLGVIRLSETEIRSNLIIWGQACANCKSELIRITFQGSLRMSDT